MKKILIKIGSSINVNQNGELDEAFLQNLADQVLHLENTGYKVYILASGSVANSGWSNSAMLNERKIKAGIGQVNMSSAYSKVFSNVGKKICQVLLHDEVINQNLGSLMQDAVKLSDVILFFNANDVLLSEHSKLKDNDYCTLLLAQICQFDHIFFLSSADGVMHNGNLLKLVTKDMLGSIEFFSNSQHGTGGMKSKLDFAMSIIDIGSCVYIANGRERNILVDIIENKAIKFTKIAKYV